MFKEIEKIFDIMMIVSYLRPENSFTNKLKVFFDMPAVPFAVFQLKQVPINFNRHMIHIWAFSVEIMSGFSSPVMRFRAYLKKSKQKAYGIPYAFKKV